MSLAREAESFLRMRYSSPVPFLPPGTEADARHDSVIGGGGGEGGGRGEPCKNEGADATNTDCGLEEKSASGANPTSRPSAVSYRGDAISRRRTLHCGFGNVHCGGFLALPGASARRETTPAFHALAIRSSHQRCSRSFSMLASDRCT